MIQPAKKPRLARQVDRVDIQTDERRKQKREAEQRASRERGCCERRPLQYARWKDTPTHRGSWSVNFVGGLISLARHFSHWLAFCPACCFTLPNNVAVLANQAKPSKDRLYGGSAMAKQGQRRGSDEATHLVFLLLINWNRRAESARHATQISKIFSTSEPKSQASNHTPNMPGKHAAVSVHPHLA